MRRKCLLWLPLSVLILFSAFRAEKTTWVAIGDSITYLNEHPDETGNRVSRGFLSRVVDQLPGIRYINQGHNGWTAVQIATEFDHLGIVPADLYTVFLGTNDWWGGKPLGSFADYRDHTGTQTVYGSFRIILDKIRQLNPRAKIVLITPMQRADFVYVSDARNNAWGSYKAKNGQWLEQFADAVSAIGRYEKVPVLDLYHTKSLDIRNLVKYKMLKDPRTGIYRKYVYPDYTDLPFDPAKDAYPYPADAIGMTFDGLHPSDRGNEIIAGMLVKLFRKMTG